MSSEETRIRERARDVYSTRIAIQTRVLYSHAAALHQAQQGKHAAFHALRGARTNLHQSKLAPLFHAPLRIDVVQGEQRLHAATQHLDTSVHQHQQEARILAKFKAIYAQVDQDVRCGEIRTERREFDAEIEDRIPLAVSAQTELIARSDAALPALYAPLRTNQALPDGRVNGVAPRAQSADQSPSNNKHSSGPASSEKHGGASKRTTVAELSATCAQAGVTLSHFETWQRLEQRGLRVEVKLSNGAPVILAISRVGGDQLAVRVSRETAPAGVSLARLKSDISKALAAQGLKIREINVVEEL